MILYPTMEGYDECEELSSKQVELEAMGCIYEEKIVADRGSFWTKTERQSCESPAWSCMSWCPYSDIKH